MSENSQKQLEIIQNLMELQQYTDALENIQAYREIWEYEVPIAILEAECMLMLAEPEMAMESIRKGLATDSSNYELYFMLGEGYEMLCNYTCAGLCYRYAAFLCDQKDDMEYLQQNINRFQSTCLEVIPRMSVLLHAADNLEWLKMCTQVMVLFNPLQSIEVIFLESQPTEEVHKWVEEQYGSKIVRCSDSQLSSLYNQGIEAADSISDILLVEEGILPLEHSIFMLQLALHQTPGAASVQSISTAEADQQYTHRICSTLEDAMVYANKYNIPKREWVKNKISLYGPIVLIRRSSLKKYGWFDEEFNTRFCQMEDLSYRFISNNQRNLICETSFTAKVYNPPILYSNEDLQYFRQKWNFNLLYSAGVRTDLMSMMHQETDTPIRVLDIGCSCGGTLIAIKNRYPNAEVFGIELDKGSAHIAGKLVSTRMENIEETTLPYPKDYFDYILFGDVLEHLHNPESVLTQMKEYLKIEGCVLASIPNVMHISNIRPLLEGKWTYVDSGILDRTHLRFFTYSEIITMFQNAGYCVLESKSNMINVSDEDKELIHTLSTIGNTSENEFLSYQYRIAAKKK